MIPFHIIYLYIFFIWVFSFTFSIPLIIFYYFTVVRIAYYSIVTSLIKSPLDGV